MAEVGGEGVLKVTVVKGKKLAVRDFKSSDPYVVLKLGNQVELQKVGISQGLSSASLEPRVSSATTSLSFETRVAKTKVINSCLNPVWNEELSFALHEPVGVLNLEVFDRDRFKADDKMGHTHISLQPIVSAARLRKILKVDSGESTTLRKVVPQSDNRLVRESSIECSNGEVGQDVWLRLVDVESGELHLRLKLINYPPPDVVAPSPPI